MLVVNFVHDIHEVDISKIQMQKNKKDIPIKGKNEVFDISYNNIIKIILKDIKLWSNTCTLDVAEVGWTWSFWEHGLDSTTLEYMGV